MISSANAGQARVRTGVVKALVREPICTRWVESALAGSHPNTCAVSPLIWVRECAGTCRGVVESISDEEILGER